MNEFRLRNTYVYLTVHSSALVPITLLSKSSDNRGHSSKNMLQYETIYNTKN